MVGCVIVKDGKVVGEGFNPKAGQPHAEVFAVRDAGDLAENSTAYVSLEPCNHFGKTPPCTEAFIKAKVKKVVIGMVDPNPIVAHKGVARLREAGIEVVVGVEEELCKSLNEAYIHCMLTGKPFLTLRYSLSVNDIRMAAPQDMAQQGIEIVALDQINVNVILDYCNCQGLNSVLLDFRGNFSEFEELIKEGIEKKYFNKFVTEILPVWNGCANMDPIMPLKSLKQGIKVIILQSKTSGQSVVLEGYFKF
ncbi:Riboflavin biosynthesis protein RibD [Sesbania bispinosa]|nr:Riboflavin biosynthesis protein RibD [Sesbania bispinosa]